MRSALAKLFFCFLFSLGFLANAQNFIANIGQWPQPFFYKMQWQHAAVYLRAEGMRFFLQDPEAFTHLHDETGKHQMPAGPIKSHVFDVIFNASGGEISPAKKASEYHNYYLGKDQKYWKSNVPLYEEVTYKSLYPGIDLVLKGGAENLKYDVIVAAGANPELIKWNYVGADALQLVNGELIIKTSVGNLLEEAPIAWQIINGQTLSVEVSFLLDENSISFKLGDYDKNHTLIIDPNYVFSSYTGSTADNFGYTATYDAAGNTYGGGIVFGNGYPVTTGAFDTVFNSGTIDVSISKFSANGVQLLYSTFLGGNKADQPHSMVVDANGNLIVLGVTGSENFPVSTTALDTTFNGGPSVNVSFMPFSTGVDMFITKFNATGTALLGSTYLGGNGTDGANLAMVRNYGDQARGEVIVAAGGDILFLSASTSSNFPTSAISYNDSLVGLQDAILGRLDSSLSVLQWSTYLGGTNNDAGLSLKLNSTETSVFVAGGTMSANFPVSPGAYQSTFAGITDGWIASFSYTTGNYFASTFNGTSGYDQNFFVALDADDDVYVFGQTKGAYPTTAGVWSVPGSAQFIHKLNSNLQQSKMSMVFGNGSNTTINISPTALMVDMCKSVYISGWGGNVNIEGNTNGMIVTANAEDPTTDGSDFYFLVLDGSWKFPEYATFFGGPGAEHVDGGTSRFSPEGVIHQAVCAGCGGQSTFPAFPSNVYSTTNNSPNCNLAVVKIDFEMLAADVNIHLKPDTICVNSVLEFTDSSSNVDVMYWDFGDGTDITGRNPVKSYDSAGVYNIKIIGVDTLCNTIDSTELTIYVFNSFAQAAFTADFDTCGLPFEVLLTNQSLGVDSLLWNFGDGTTSSLLNPTKIYSKPGAYTIYLAAKDSICNNWDTAFVTVVFKFSGGAVAFEAQYDYCTDWQKVTLIPANGNNYQLFVWDFGDGQRDTSKFPVYNYAQPGTYTIQLTAVDTVCNISSVASQTIDIKQFQEVQEELFPNIFTPNGDGTNDTWQLLGDVSTSQFVDFKLEVYNRWGGLVLTSYDAAYQWHGNYLEDDLAEGVYFWLVWYTDICGNKAERHGQVTIMK